MKPLLGTLFLVVLAALLPAAIVLADSDDDVRVEAAASPALATEDHDLAAASFGPLFVDKSISGDTIAFAFEITNLGKLADTGDWRIVSNNTTSDLADDILIASGSAGLDPGFSLRSGPAGISWNTMGAKLGTHTVTLSVGQVPGETTIANNKKDLVVVLVDRPTHDVAVTGITPTKEDGSPLGTGQLPSGAKINVNVTTRNRGSVTETFGLTLTAAQGTTTREVSRVNVTLDSGDELTLGLVWDTLGAKPGTQKLTATAAVSGDEDTSNDSSTADVDITIVLAQIDIQGADGLFPADPSNAPLVMKNPRLTTTVNALSARFIRNHSALFGAGITLVDPKVTTHVNPLSARFIRNHGALFGDGASVKNPKLTTEVKPLAARFIRNEDALFGDGIMVAKVKIPTGVKPLSNRFIRNQDALFGVGISVRNLKLTTQVKGLTNAFIRNQSAIFGQGLRLRNSFSATTQRVTIRKR